jgi:hypothetical protein
LRNVFLINWVATLLSSATYAGPMPKSNTAQYIIDHLDVRSFPSSIGPRREKTKVTFKDYGLLPAKIDMVFAQLKETNESWEFDLKVILATETEILVCIHDFALKEAHYNAQQPVMLVWDDNTKTFISDKKKHTSKDCPEFAR